MGTQKLFNSNGTWVTRDDLQTALVKVKAQECRVLYMHTGLSFGLPNPELSRADLLQALYETVRELGVNTLCVPTFTFSFCNGEEYDVEKSRSRMGALNEHIRRRPEALRSMDPLMSAAIVGEDRDLAENLGRESTGENSTFDKLSRRKDVRFLFLGVRLADCFTYMHYLEWLAKVPYRYNRKFSGKITSAGKTWEDTYTLFVRYNNVKPNATTTCSYERLLSERGLLRVAALGDNAVSCIAEPDARELYLELLRKDPNYFIERPFLPHEADPTFVARDMVAL